jgi:hypothetical protein
VGEVSPTAKYSEILAGGSVNRLDAEYHDPLRIARETSLKAQGGSALITRVSITDDRVPDPRKAAKGGDTFAYVEISGVDMRDGFVTAETVAAADAPSRARLKLDEGVVALSSVRPARSQVFVTSADLVGAVGTTGFITLKPRSAKELSPELLFALLKSACVVDQLDRRARASMYPTLAPDDVGDVVLPLLPDRVVKEVEAGIQDALSERQVFLTHIAERRRLEAAMFSPLRPDKLLADLESGGPTTRTRGELIEGEAVGRIDAEFHSKAYDAAIARMKAAGRVKLLGDWLTAADTGNSPSEDEYRDVDSPGSSAVLKVGALSGMGIQWCAVEYAPGKYSEKDTTSIEEGDVVFNSTAHQPKYMAHKVDVVRAVPATLDGRLTFVGEMLRLRLAPSACVPPEYLAAFLRNPLGREQIRRCIRGISSHVYPDDIERIVVPVPSKKDAREVADVIRLVEKARWRYSTAVLAAIGAIDAYVAGVLGAD